MAIAEIAGAPGAVEETTVLSAGGAFGLEVLATYDIPALAEVNGAAQARRTICRERDARELEREWREEEADRAVELRHPDGRLFMSISRHPDLGYHVWAPRHGRHVISNDGRQIWSALPRRSPLGWQRLFFAQTLPLAAALQGLEVLHASAVSVAGRAIAFTASSGTGKSSLAAHAVAFGAEFVTDDVLALELVEGAVLAHPGPRRASLAASELRAMQPNGRLRLGTCIGETDKLHLEPPSVSAALPLAIVYRVRRTTNAGGPRFREHVPPEPRQVLASSFLPYLGTRERLLNQLSICEGIVRFVRMFDFEIPASVSAQTAAAVALAHIEDVLSA